MLAHWLAEGSGCEKDSSGPWFKSSVSMRCLVLETGGWSNTSQCLVRTIRPLPSRPERDENKSTMNISIEQMYIRSLLIRRTEIMFDQRTGLAKRLAHTAIVVVAETTVQHDFDGTVQDGSATLTAI